MHTCGYNIFATDLPKKKTAIHFMVSSLAIFRLKSTSNEKIFTNKSLNRATRWSFTHSHQLHWWVIIVWKHIFAHWLIYLPIYLFVLFWMFLQLLCDQFIIRLLSAYLYTFNGRQKWLHIPAFGHILFLSIWHILILDNAVYSSRIVLFLLSVVGIFDYGICVLNVFT